MASEKRIISNQSNDVLQAALQEHRATQRREKTLNQLKKQLIDNVTSGERFFKRCEKLFERGLTKEQLELVQHWESKMCTAWPQGVEDVRQECNKFGSHAARLLEQRIAYGTVLYIVQYPGLLVDDRIALIVAAFLRTYILFGRNMNDVMALFYEPEAAKFMAFFIALNTVLIPSRNGKPMTRRDLSRYWERWEIFLGEKRSKAKPGSEKRGPTVKEEFDTAYDKHIKYPALTLQEIIRRTDPIQYGALNFNTATGREKLKAFRQALDRIHGRKINWPKPKPKTLHKKYPARN